jgi:AcrR family transcriptional regulator
MSETTTKPVTPSMVVLPGGRSPRGADRVVPRGRHGHPREEIEVIQRARILDAFANELGAAGLNGAHVANICGAAGVSTKEFYAVFKSKDECFLAAFDLGAEMVIEQGAAAFGKKRGLWEERVRAAIKAMLEVLQANPDFARLCVVEVYHATGGLERLNGVINRCRWMFGGGDRPPDPGDAFESALIGSAFRPIAEYVADGKADRLTELVPVMTYSLALPVVGWERAARQLHPSNE